MLGFGLLAAAHATLSRNENKTVKLQLFIRLAFNIQSISYGLAMLSRDAMGRTEDRFHPSTLHEDFYKWASGGSGGSEPLGM